MHKEKDKKTKIFCTSNAKINNPPTTLKFNHGTVNNEVSIKH